MSWLTRIFGITSKHRFPDDAPPTLKENVQALKNIPKFLIMIWQTHRSMTVGNVILRLIQAGVPVTTLYIGKLIIDEVVHLIDIYQAEGQVNMDQLYLYIGLEFAITILSAIITRGIGLLDALLGDLLSNKTSIMLISHAAELDLPQFEDSSLYDKLERARRQTTSRVRLMSQLLSQLQDIITMVFLAAGLVFFNPWLIILLVLAVIPSFISETYFNRRGYSLARSWTPERRELDYLRFIGASDQTVKEVKIFGLSPFLQERFKTVSDKYYEANRKLAIKRASWGVVLNSLGDGGYYVAYVMIVLQTVTGTFSLGDLTFLAGSFRRLRGLLRGILSRFSTIAESALYLQDLFDFLELEPKIISPDKPRPLPKKIKEGFIFENVSFKYPNSERYAVQNLSFVLHAGEKLALVGENGAGKTTLVKLLARLYDPTEGHILLDGYNLKEYDIKALRKFIGVIFQDYVKFQMTVSDNIAVGDISLREELALIEQAAKQSMADAVIKKLPGGYDQMLGRRFARGVELSGGEWQKVALGRAYMREAQLLILDEPTAALDARAEYEVFQRFSELTLGKTAVLISHRFSTVRMADRILVLEKGKMLEIGSHEELLAREGVYAELFHLQAEGYH